MAPQFIYVVTLFPPSSFLHPQQIVKHTFLFMAYQYVKYLQCMKIILQKLVSTHYNIFVNSWLKLYWIQTVGKWQLVRQV